MSRLAVLVALLNALEGVTLRTELELSYLRHASPPPFLSAERPGQEVQYHPGRSTYALRGSS